MCEVRGVGDHDVRDLAFNKRAEGTTWALLLVITGVAFLMPGWRMSWAVWLTGVGIILLGLNAVRRSKGVRARWTSTILGGLGLVAGLGNFAGMDLELPLFALFLILSGAGIMLRPLLRAER